MCLWVCYLLGLHPLYSERGIITPVMQKYLGLQMQEPNWDPFEKLWSFWSFALGPLLVWDALPGFCCLFIGKSLRISWDSVSESPPCMWPPWVTYCIPQSSVLSGYDQKGALGYILPVHELCTEWFPLKLIWMLLLFLSTVLAFTTLHSNAPHLNLHLCDWKVISGALKSPVSG